MSQRRPKDTWQRIYAVVRRIPRGRVATYGQVAALAGLPNHARHVGYALNALEADSLRAMASGDQRGRTNFLCVTQPPRGKSSDWRRKM